MTTYKLIGAFAVTIFLIVFITFNIKNNKEGKGCLANASNIFGLIISVSVFCGLLFYLFNNISQDIKLRNRYSNAKVDDAICIIIEPFLDDRLVDSSILISEKTTVRKLFSLIKNAEEVYQSSKGNRKWTVRITAYYKNKEANTFEIDKIQNGETFVSLLRDGSEIDIFKNDKLGSVLEEVVDKSNRQGDPL